MADETRDTREETYEQDAPQDVEEESFRDEPAPPGDGDRYDEPAPELGQLNRDYTIPGVTSEETNPYRWHTGAKRDHGGEDAIEIIDLVKQFGRTRILNGLNLGLPDNQISMVLGPSGTGKSVLIKHIVGLLYPDAGDVLVHGESVPNMTDDELFEMRKKFGLLFQDGALFGSMDVFDNTALPRPPRRCPTSCREGCASELASLERWSWIRRSSCSTSRTQDSIRCGRPSCAS